MPPRKRASGAGAGAGPGSGRKKKRGRSAGVQNGTGGLAELDPEEVLAPVRALRETERGKWRRQRRQQQREEEEEKANRRRGKGRRRSDLGAEDEEEEEDEEDEEEEGQNSATATQTGTVATVATAAAAAAAARSTAGGGQGEAQWREVREMRREEVQGRIEDEVVQQVRAIMAGDAVSYQIVSRAAGNQVYVPELDRIVLGQKLSTRSFLNTSHVRKTAITTRAMELVHEVLRRDIHITKRDLFYTDVKLFQDQGESDAVLDDIACMMGCTRTSLNVVASDKGLVVGRIQFTEAGDHIDCTRMGIGGKAIPPLVDRIDNVRSDADFILLVEKEAAYMRLAEDRFYHKYPCIIITAKGQPDVATRRFLKRIRTELQLPVLGLVDSDPYGLKILSVYMSGSKNMSYDSASLTTPDIKWLGVRPSDLERYNLPEQCRLDMTAKDIKAGQDLLKEEFVLKNPAWVAELETMLATKKKAEIQALSSFGFQFITESYLPQKLQNADWI